MEVERGTACASCGVGEECGGRQHGTHSHPTASTVRNIEIDWREVDPYFSELSDCASFWTLINFTCDVIYSGLFVLFFIMGQDVESMFFEGLLNHINPILIYLILSLIINYGALRSLRCGKEKCFLTFSIMKGLLFPVTMSLLIYLVLFDVQEYFGTFWISFVVIVSCYNGTSALGLWSMFTCNKYILVNEAAQKRLRKQAKQQRAINHRDCRCESSTMSALVYCDNNQIASRPNSCVTSTELPNCSRVRASSDLLPSSSGASNIILVYKPNNCANKSSSKRNAKQFTNKTSYDAQRSGGGSSCVGGTSRIATLESGNVMSFGEEDDEVLQISTVHKVMQEIRLLDSHNAIDDSSGDEGDSL